MTLFFRIGNVFDLQANECETSEYQLMATINQLREVQQTTIISNTNPDFHDDILRFNIEKREGLDVVMQLMNITPKGPVSIAGIKIPLPCIPKNKKIKIILELINYSLSTSPKINLEIHYDTKGTEPFNARSGHLHDDVFLNGITHQLTRKKGSTGNPSLDYSLYVQNYNKLNGVDPVKKKKKDDRKRITSATPPPEKRNVNSFSLNEKTKMEPDQPGANDKDSNMTIIDLANQMSSQDANDQLFNAKRRVVSTRAVIASRKSRNSLDLKSVNFNLNFDEDGEGQNKNLNSSVQAKGLPPKLPDLESLTLSQNSESLKIEIKNDSPSLQSYTTPNLPTMQGAQQQQFSSSTNLPDIPELPQVGTPPGLPELPPVGNLPDIPPLGSGGLPDVAQLSSGEFPGASPFGSILQNTQTFPQTSGGFQPGFPQLPSSAPFDNGLGNGLLSPIPENEGPKPSTAVQPGVPPPNVRGPHLPLGRFPSSDSFQAQQVTIGQLGALAQPPPRRAPLGGERIQLGQMPKPVRSSTAVFRIRPTAASPAPYSPSNPYLQQHQYYQQQQPNYYQPQPQPQFYQQPQPQFFQAPGVPMMAAQGPVYPIMPNQFGLPGVPEMSGVPQQPPAQLGIPLQQTQGLGTAPQTNTAPQPTTAPGTAATAAPQRPRKASEREIVMYTAHLIGQGYDDAYIKNFRATRPDVFNEYALQLASM